MSHIIWILYGSLIMTQYSNYSCGYLRISKVASSADRKEAKLITTSASLCFSIASDMCL